MLFKCSINPYIASPLLHLPMVTVFVHIDQELGIMALNWRFLMGIWNGHGCAKALQFSAFEFFFTHNFHFQHDTRHLCPYNPCILTMVTFYGLCLLHLVSRSKQFPFWSTFITPFWCDFNVFQKSSIARRPFAILHLPWVNSQVLIHPPQYNINLLILLCRINSVPPPQFSHQSDLTTILLA